MKTTYLKKILNSASQNKNIKVITRAALPTNPMNMINFKDKLSK